MKSFEDHLHYLEDENKEYVRSLEKMKAQLDEAEQQHEKMIEEMESLRISLQSEQQKNEHLRKTKDRNDEELANHKTRIGQIEDLVTKYKKESLELERCNQELAGKIPKKLSETEVEALKQKNDVLRQNLDEVMSENKNLQDTLTSLKLRNDNDEEFQKIISQLEDSLNKKDEEIKCQKDLNRKIFEDNIHVNEALEKLQGELSNTQAKCDELRVGEEEAQKLLAELSTIKCQYNCEVEKNTKLSEEILSLKRQMQSDQNDLIVEKQKLSFDIKKLENEIIQIKQDHEKDLFQRHLQYEQKEEHLKEHYRRETIEKQSLRKQVSDFKRKMHLVISKNDSLNKEFRETLMRLSKMVPFVDELKTQIDSIILKYPVNSSNSTP